jgi:hypothetical protein
VVTVAPGLVAIVGGGDTESWFGAVAAPIRFGLWMLWERTQYFREMLLHTMTYVVCNYRETTPLYSPTPVRRAGLSWPDQKALLERSQTLPK